ncbi:MAG: cytochrome c maturation protein CcmE [Gammaproteobacteria bacterium]|nr:cytochrome c maturation protein CcmE [Pseudomonadota bacterium]MCH9664169.1 cytochrome c maturation protein CcmE [Gammaproteobacteria bacterium]
MSLLPTNPRRRRRLVLLVAMVAVLALATALILAAFEKNLMYFYTPSDITEGHIHPGGVIELGGMVEPGSVKRAGADLQVEFNVSDGVSRLAVVYQGSLPDLFREGQGVVVYGRLLDGKIHASRILARHDENYMPQHLEKKLRKTGAIDGQGHYQPPGGAQ